MLMGNAIAYDWLYSVLTPDERLLVGTSLAHWANAMLEASEQPIPRRLEQLVDQILRPESLLDQQQRPGAGRAGRAR